MTEQIVDSVDDIWNTVQLIKDMKTLSQILDITIHTPLVTYWFSEPMFRDLLSLKLKDERLSMKPQYDALEWSLIESILKVCFQDGKFVELIDKEAYKNKLIESKSVVENVAEHKFRMQPENVDMLLTSLDYMVVNDGSVRFLSAQKEYELFEHEMCVEKTVASCKGVKAIDAKIEELSK